MVVLNANHRYEFVGSYPFKLDDEPPLLVQPHRMLGAAIALQLFEMQGLQVVKDSFVRSRPDDLHYLPIGRYNRLVEASRRMSGPSPAGRALGL